MDSRGETSSDAAGRDAVYFKEVKYQRDASHQDGMFTSILRIVPGKDGTLTSGLLGPRRTGCYRFAARPWVGPANGLKSCVFYSAASAQG